MTTTTTTSSSTTTASSSSKLKKDKYDKSGVKKSKSGKKRQEKLDAKHTKKKPKAATFNKRKEREERTDVWSKSKKKRMRSRKKQRNDGDALTKKKDQEDVDPKKVDVDKNSDPTTTEEDSETKNSTTTTTINKKLQGFQDRLSGSRFRMLNERLYTTTSRTAFDQFKAQPTLFDEYHEGFRQQVQSWPINPIDVIVEKIVTDDIPESGNRVVIVDFGCGDAELAKQLLASSKKDRIDTIHSLDLVASGPNAELITAPIDSTHTKLPHGSVDIGIFCLSLMGTNLADFIREAHRILKPNAVLHIVEVQSRFYDSKKDDCLTEFIAVLKKLGFDTIEQNTTKMFLTLKCTRNAAMKPKKNLKYTAKPCIYKRR